LATTKIGSEKAKATLGRGEKAASSSNKPAAKKETKKKASSTSKLSPEVNTNYVDGQIGTNWLRANRFKSLLAISTKRLLTRLRLKYPLKLLVIYHFENLIWILKFASEDGIVTPLGTLILDQIEKGEEVLQKMYPLLSKKGKDKELEQLSGEFYTMYELSWQLQWH